MQVQYHCTANGLLASTAVDTFDAADGAALPAMPHACSLFSSRTLHQMVCWMLRPCKFTAAAFQMPCEHHASQKETALSAVPEPCPWCLTKCDALPPGFDVCGSNRSALQWTSLPLPDTCPAGFIFVWLAKTDIQAAFQQMEHWVSHC